MPENLFDKHFTISEANDWIVRLRGDLERLHQLIESLDEDISALRPVLERRGNGGGIDTRRYIAADDGLSEILDPIQEAGILIKDLRRGLVDFPHLKAGEGEVFLCWELSDPDKIEWYHEIEAGYSGRKPLDES